jgi:hypothetical protein
MRKKGCLPLGKCVKKMRQESLEKIRELQIDSEDGL